MLKIKKVTYTGETVNFKDESFTKGFNYFIRNSKDSMFEVINMDNGIDRVLRTDYFSYIYDTNLMNKFTFVEYLYFKNLKEYRNYLKNYLKG